MPTQSRTVRVFLSSTFRDFAEERDLLVRKVFPELRRQCRARQVELVDVDLRWGITEEEAQQGRVLPICLAEIDRSRPFFMGFIGERYGWIPEQEKYDLSLIMEQPWLDEHRGGKSLTELEMLHGVLNNPAMEDRAFFYFRDAAYSNSKGGAYLSESEADKAKLEALKDRIRKSGYPVVEDYPTPEAIAERVKEDLWKLIDEAFPENEVPDALAQERMRHEAFAASRLGLYIGGERYFEALDAAMAEEPCKPLLVCGASGGGKSALLANWAQRFSSAHPEAIVLTHFLGTGADAAHPVNMAIRLLREMARITGEEFVLEGDPRKALRMLGEWLEKAGAFARERGGVFVLVLDALDKMTEHRDLDWWPRKMPEGVAMVASCLDGGLRDTVARRMEWTEVRVSPLEPMDCERFMEDHLAKYRKAVTPEQKALILAHPLCGNPLFLRTLLEELRVFGVHEELRGRLAHYLACETIDDLFERVLERVETDNSPESVRSVLEILWAAKESFAEDELLEVTGLPPAVWAPIYIALDESLIGAGGRLAFSHDYLRKAVQDRYLAEEKDRKSIRKKLAEFCASAMESGRKELSPYIRRHAVEHFLEVEDWDNATAALSDLEFIEARAIAQELPAMLKDYAEAVKLLPEGEKERQTEAARQAELDRYARKMYEYSAAWSRIRDGSGEAEPQLPRPVESVRLWTEEEIAAECKRLTETPNSFDIVKAFRVFVAINSAPLQQYSTQEGFAANLARNDAPAGPVHEEGERRLELLKCIKLIKQFAPEEIYNPKPACQAVLETSVTCVALSIDEHKAYSGGADGIIRVWDIKSNACINAFEGHELSINSITLSSDEKYIISASDDETIRIWDTLTYDCLKILRGHNGGVTSLFITDNAEFIFSGSWDETIRVWNTETGKCINVIYGQKGGVESFVNCDGDSYVVVKTGDDLLRIWDLKSHKCIKEFGSSIAINSPLVLTRDGKHIISASYLDDSVQVWTLHSGSPCMLLEGHKGSINSISLSRDGRFIVSGSDDKTVRVWDSDSGKCLKVLNGHVKAVKTTALSVNNSLAISGSDDGTLRVWDLESSESPNVLQDSNHQAQIFFRSVSNHVISKKGYTKNLQVWNTRQKSCPVLLEGHSSGISAVALSSNEKQIFTASKDETIRCWNTKTGQCHRILDVRHGKISSIAVSMSGRVLISGDENGEICLWDLVNDFCSKFIGNHNCKVVSIRIGANDRRAVTLDEKDTLCIWDLENGKCLKKKQMRNIYPILSENGLQVISGVWNSKLYLWDLETGKCLKKLKWLQGGGDYSPVNRMFLSADGRFVIGRCYNYSVGIWSIETEYFKFLKGHTRDVTCFGLSADMRYAVSGSSDNTFCFWSILTSKCIARFFARGITDMALNWPNSTLLLGFSDGRVEFYNIENLPLGPFITTAQREIFSEDLPTGSVTARPVCCGEQISIPPTIVNRIEHWALEGGEGGYTDPALLLDCSNCSTPLRMNPFFVDIQANN
jgi:nephrocystin-3